MDDDMQMLGTVLSRPGPAPEAITAGRRRLEQAIRVPVQPARGWRRSAVAVTTIAAGVAAAAVIPNLAHNPATHAVPHAANAVSGRQILLDAARTAAAAPQAPGTYWYVKEAVTFTGQPVYTRQTWTTRSGEVWNALPGGGAYPMSPADGFDVGWDGLTLSELQGLPTTPAALKAWVTSSGSRFLSGPASAGTANIAQFLSELLYQVPAPPAVRAAVFEALASMPDVRTLGSVPGGQKLVISVPLAASRLSDGKTPAAAGEITLVINPATAALRSVTNFEGTITILADEWTNTLPRNVTLPRKESKR